ncbi:ATP-binding protein [Melaminivora sp.]
MSRPRRFGKSLFLDTLAELFEGNESLFRGLQCHGQWDWAQRYPVIRLSFGAGRLSSAAGLHEHIQASLDDNAVRLNVSLEPPTQSPHLRFRQLIQQAHAQHGQRVVVLVDEYDKPILDNLTEPAIARQMRDGLRDLYSVIKDNDAHIRFAFLTGVSKFSKVSIFSGLNNLRDITLSSDYSALCGYTDADVDTVFAPELPGLDRQQIRAWYNGYNWTGTSVYNPFDLLLLFEEREFRPYWFETGTPTFLVDWLTRQQATFTPQLESWQTDLDLLGAFDIDHIEPEALLWQTGYLTIASTRQLPGMTEVHLTLPNREVRASLNAALLRRLQGRSQPASRHLPRLYDVLMAHDMTALEQLLHSFFASIPHDWYRNNPIAQYEGYWASIFYSHFAALGLDIRLEDVTNQGRIDMAVLFNGQVYLFEFKVVEQTPEGKALAQLQAKNYAEKYRSRGEPMHLIGVEFSSSARNVVGFELLTLP